MTEHLGAGATPGGSAVIYTRFEQFQDGASLRRDLWRLALLYRLRLAWAERHAHHYNPSLMAFWYADIYRRYAVKAYARMQRSGMGASQMVAWWHSIARWEGE